MSFLSSLRKSMSGQSYSTGTQTSNNVSPLTTTKPSGVIKGDPRTFPVVYIKHTKCHLNNNRMQIYCSVVNSSQSEIELHIIRILSTSRNLGNFLKPGQEHECLVYDGPTAKNDHDREVHLDYKDHSGDYFESIHDIKFTYQANDRSYIIDDIHLRLPIKDING